MRPIRPTPSTSTQRARAANERLAAAGGAVRHIRLTPTAVEALSALQAVSGLGASETVCRALLVADAARRLYPADAAVSLTGVGDASIG